MGRDFSVPCGMLSSVPGFYSLDDNSTHPPTILTTKMFPDVTKCATPTPHPPPPTGSHWIRCICPAGKKVLFTATDEGHTWDVEPPRLHGPPPQASPTSPGPRHLLRSPRSKPQLPGATQAFPFQKSQLRRNSAAPLFTSPPPTTGSTHTLSEHLFHPPSLSSDQSEEESTWTEN